MKFLKSTLAGTRFLGSRAHASGFEAAETGGHDTRHRNLQPKTPHVSVIPFTLNETNIATENGPSEKETTSSIPTIRFSGAKLLLVSGRVIHPRSSLSFKLRSGFGAIGCHLEIFSRQWNKVKKKRQQ